MTTLFFLWDSNRFSAKSLWAEPPADSWGNARQMYSTCWKKNEQGPHRASKKPYTDLIFGGISWRGRIPVLLLPAPPRQYFIGSTFHPCTEIIGSLSKTLREKWLFPSLLHSYLVSWREEASPSLLHTRRGHQVFCGAWCQLNNVTPVFVCHSKFSQTSPTDRNISFILVLPWWFILVSTCGSGSERRRFLACFLPRGQETPTGSVPVYMLQKSCWVARKEESHR